MALSLSTAHLTAEANHATRLAAITSTWQSATQGAKDTYPDGGSTYAQAIAAADAARNAAIAASTRQLNADRSALQRAQIEFGQSASASNSAAVFAVLAVKEGADPTVAAAALDV